MKNIVILGSTGSIGTQTLEVIQGDEHFNVLGLSTYSNIDLIEEQIKRYHPKVVAVMNEEKARTLQKCVGKKTEIVTGVEGLIALATLTEAHVVVTAVVGMVGLLPTIGAIKAGKDIALANKETLVTAGSLIMPLAEKNGVSILPVDSEHSAIFQCLQGENKKEVEKLILTASGGPFRGKKINDLKAISVEEALKHPNWSMGSKISIDSATLMNKGLEVIEAKWLFDIEVDRVETLIHPQSIIHSMVEYKDGSVMAQLGQPDMRLPIQYALNFPRRTSSPREKTDFTKLAPLTFEAPDLDTFHSLALAYEAIRIGGTMPTVLNAANEYAVAKFLRHELSFLEIPYLVNYAMERHQVIKTPTVDHILATEKWTYEILESR